MRSRVCITSMVTSTINWIFITFSHSVHASAGYSAKIVVTFIQSTNPMRVMVTGLKGKRHRSDEITTATKVATPTISAKGKSYAKPHVNLWGFMSPIHVQSSTPTHARASTNGSRPRMNSVRAMSRNDMSYLGFT